MSNYVPTKHHLREVLPYPIVTGDEKWICHDNPMRKISWGKPGQPSTSTPKPNNVHGIEAHILYLVGSAECSVL